MIRRRNRRSFTLFRSEGSNGLATYKQTKKVAAWRRHACYRRPNFSVGSLCDVVSSYQVWFGSVHNLPEIYSGKSVPDQARVNVIDWLRPANK